MTMPPTLDKSPTRVLASEQLPREREREREYSIVEPYTLSNLPEAGNGSPRHHVGNVLGTRLENTAEEEDDRSYQDGPFAAELVAEGSGGHGAKEGTARENGDDGANLGRVVSELGSEGISSDDLSDDAEIVAIGEGS